MMQINLFSIKKSTVLLLRKIGTWTLSDRRGQVKVFMVGFEVRMVQVNLF